MNININILEVLIKNNFLLKSHEELLELQFFLQKNPLNFLILKEEERIKRIIVNNKITCSLNDLILINNLLIKPSNSNPITDIITTIYNNKTIRFSIEPCKKILKELINYLPLIKDKRFIKTFLKKEIENFTEKEKEIICIYLQDYIEIPYKLFPKKHNKIKLNKNTINCFLKSENTEILKYFELIFEEIIIFSNKSLKVFLKNNNEVSLNFIALKILYKQYLSIEQITFLLDFICLKCLKSVLFDLSNCFNDYRFMIFNFNPFIVYNSFNLLKSNTFRYNYNYNIKCLFYKYCLNKIDTQRYFELINLDLPDLLSISFFKIKKFNIYDNQLINKIDRIYNSNLNIIFNNKIKRNKNKNIINYDELLITYEELIKMNDLVKNIDVNNFLRQLDSLKIFQRKEIFKKIGLMKFNFNNEISSFNLFLNLILKDIFFKELDINLFLKYTSLKVFINKKLSLSFFNKFIKAVTNNINNYNEEDILIIIFNSLKKYKVALIELQTIIFNILFCIKKILNSNFLTKNILNLIQEICFHILDFFENFPENNKIEMILELIYEKIKIKSKYLMINVKVKTVKKKSIDKHHD